MPDSKRFLHPEAIKRISRLDLRAQHIVEGFLSGIHRSPYFGQSVEFLQHREYTPGDDLRHVDWQVWARQDRLYVKQFEEDTNMRVNLLVDVSRSMEYGNGPFNKYEYAATIATSLAFLILKSQDAVGCLTFDAAVRAKVQTLSKRTQLMAIIQSLDVNRPADKTGLADIFSEAAETYPRRGMMMVDFGFVWRCRIDACGDCGCFVNAATMCWCCTSWTTMKLEFPFSGPTGLRILNLTCGSTVIPKALREGYLEALQEFLDEIRHGCAKSAIDYALIRTSEPLDAALAHFSVAAWRKTGVGNMFDNLFSNSPAVWGGLIGVMIALPILVHLINLMRHKRVKWAAMEFLLKSHKKNRNWVWLKQAFLLLARIAVLILSLLMFAQIGCNDNRISDLLGGATTHHYVLLDDSFSMGDRASDGTAFDRALSTLSLISSRAKNRENQLFSILRFSQARPDPDNRAGAAASGKVEAGGTSGSMMNPVADLDGEWVDNLFDQRIEDVKARMAVSTLAVGLKDSLEVVSQSIGTRRNENAILYVLSDFRQRDWKNTTDISKLLTDIDSTGAAIEMIACTRTVQQNLALTDIQPVGHVRVAGAPLMMQVTVKNCSDSIAEKVQVKLGSLAFPEPTPGTIAENVRPDYVEIPSVFIQSIAPGESETRSFPVCFRTAGVHVVVGSIPADAVAVDNERWNVTEIFDSAKILLIDDSRQMNSHFMSLALNPGGMTGIDPDCRTRDFLRDVSLESLFDYDVVILMDVDSLEESSIKNLESFAADGGGVVFFLGPNSNLESYNSALYRGGDGLFPMLLERSIEIPEQGNTRVPDIVPHEHPMFAPVLAGTNSLLDLVQVARIVQPAPEWNLKKSGDVTVAATIRGLEGWPLIVERAFGNGRVMVFTTTAGPIWNNWSRNVTFPPIMLLMEDYLAAGKYDGQQRMVGSSIEIGVSSNEYLPGLTILAPDGGDESRMVSRTRMGMSAVGSDMLGMTIGKRFPGHSMRETDVPGIYDVWFRRTDSAQEVRRFALNVDTSESELALANRQKLLADLNRWKPTLVDWDQFNPEPTQKPASSLSRLLLVILVLTLVVEQLLAYSTSYHQKSPTTSSRPERRGSR